jgi:hypothetical protein
LESGVAELHQPLARTAWRRFGPGNLWPTYALGLLAYAGGLVAVGNPPIDDTIPIRVALKHATAGSSVGIASGAGHTCALMNRGVQCWGDNGNGLLGKHSKPDSHVPVWVSGLTP